MKKRILSMLFVLSPFMVPASVQAQWVVSPIRATSSRVS